MAHRAHIIHPAKMAKTIITDNRSTDSSAVLDYGSCSSISLPDVDGFYHVLEAARWSN